jgi:hypothetical protein
MNDFWFNFKIKTFCKKCKPLFNNSGQDYVRYHLIIWKTYGKY